MEPASGMAGSVRSSSFCLSCLLSSVLGQPLLYYNRITSCFKGTLQNNEERGPRDEQIAEATTSRWIHFKKAFLPSHPGTVLHPEWKFWQEKLRLSLCRAQIARISSQPCVARWSLAAPSFILSRSPSPELRFPRKSSQDRFSLIRRRTFS